MTDDATPVLILGIGNLLMSDEGAGLHVIAALEAGWRLPDGVTVLDGGTAGMELLTPITAARRLVVVDAVVTGAAPGTVVRLDDDAVPSFLRSKLSPHQVGLADVLASARLLDWTPDSLTLFGVVPDRLELGLELSATVRARVPELVAHVVAELGRLGLPPSPQEVKGIGLA